MVEGWVPTEQMQMTENKTEETKYNEHLKDDTDGEVMIGSKGVSRNNLHTVRDIQSFNPALDDTYQMFKKYDEHRAKS